MRLTIARKIALAVIAIVILSIGTMAWVTSQNLKSGFIAYLNQLEAQDLEQLSNLLADEVRQHGNLQRFQDNRRAMRELLDSLHPTGQLQRSGATSEPRARQRPEHRPPPPYGAHPAFDAEPERGERPRPSNAPADAAPRRPPPIDPTGFAQRLSILNQDGQALIGPPDAPAGIVQPIVLDGRTVGSLRLAPLRQILDTSGSGFVRAQIRQILWLAGALITLSILLSIWLARHLLRPVAALGSVTQRIAQGQLEARATVMSQDELGELALHVNAMAHSLQQNEAQRRQLLADISHELRTPLTVIRGELEALLDGVRQTSPGALKSLHEEVLRLNKLIDDIAQINLADAGALRLQLQPTDLGALLHSVLERYRARLQAAGLGVSSELPATPCRVTADPDRLSQVLCNLFENSLRYTDAGGRLHCSLARHGALIELCLEDSAPGVPQASHARLFERLYRFDHHRSRERGGSGLGLAICQALITSHKGKIFAQPSDLGGIKIVIRLPALD